jgi:phage terminase large subunit-like protein
MVSVPERHRSGGPRPDIRAEPLDLSDLGRQRATRAVRFMELLTVPKGKGARSRLRLRRWQKAIVRAVLAPGIRTAVVAIPRGNGKSTLAAAMGLIRADGASGGWSSSGRDDA